MGLEHEEPDRVGRVLVEDLLERVEVPEALGHLLAVDAQHAGVHPDVGEGLVPGAHGLGGLVLVVREDEVGAAAVDVDRRAEVAMDHRAALGVPAGAAGTPGGVPAGLAGLGGLPQREVEGVALLVIDLDALASAQLVEVAAGEDAVVVVGAHREVHVAGGHGVGVALLDEDLDHLLHRGDLLRRAGADVGVEDAEAMHLLDEGGGELLGDVGGGASLLVRAVDDLVVHVGEVLGEGDLVPLEHEVATNHVEGEERAPVADVDLVVDRGAADVHADLVGLDGPELFLAVGLGVVDLHWLVTPQSACVSTRIVAATPPYGEKVRPG